MSKNLIYKGIYVKRTREDILDQLKVKYADGTMTDSQFRSTVTDYLLGKDFYVVGPVSQDQANYLIFESIVRNFKGGK